MTSGKWNVFPRVCVWDKVDIVDAIVADSQKEGDFGRGEVLLIRYGKPHTLEEDEWNVKGLE
ncbi:hypothetical protein JCGZ_03085 [Jatropha curcas]|uniref:Uncharacterized protein n=1 Tax=Jatropha curcas TaxID=180498 RepID=A0A067L0R5_JATCU|nr:hypothetical protein JCGZ_03085 [Jatropha curcas]